MLATRIATAVVLAAAVLAAMFLLPARGWAVLMLAVVLLAAHEWAALAGLRERRWLLFVGGVFLIAFSLLFGTARFEQGWPDRLVLAVCGAATAFWLLVAPIWLRGHWRLDNPLLAALVGWLLLVATWVAVVELQARSPWLVLAAMALVWTADTAAYFSGRAFGRRKLAPSISPGKTWEGVAGAGVAVGVYALLLAFATPGFGYAGPRDARALLVAVVLALAVAAVSIVGDLFESLLKRQRGVKDSGRLLPGHGGVLDRIDALLAAMPAAALLAIVFLPSGH